MADFYTVAATATKGGFVVPGGYKDQPVKVQVEEYTTTGVEAAGDVIHCLKPPAGYRFIGGQLTWAALSAGITLAVGVTGTATLFVGATSAAAEGGVSLQPLTNGQNGYVFDGNTEIIITLGVGGADSVAASNLIRGVFKLLGPQ